MKMHMQGNSNHGAEQEYIYFKLYIALNEINMFLNVF